MKTRGAAGHTTGKGGTPTMGRKCHTGRRNSSAEDRGRSLGVDGLSGSPEAENGGNREPKNRSGAGVCSGASPVATHLDESIIDDAVIGRYPIRTDFKFW